LQTRQAIQNPLGVTVFGSAIIRIEPDVASLQFSVVQIAKQPKEAFSTTRQIAAKIHKYLRDAGIQDVKASSIQLREWRSIGSRNQEPDGYETELEFHILLDDTERIEEILVGVIEIGANRIRHVGLDTTHLKELRADVRQRAIIAARQKAKIYCEAAGVEIGKVLHIEDMNPEKMRKYSGHGGVQQIELDYDETPRAFNPGSIIVNAAVKVTYALKE